MENTYDYIPEMGGITEIQQRQFRNRMNTAVQQLNTSGARSNLQSGGAYLAQRKKLAGRQATGLADIQAQNQLKSAMFAIEDRRRRENQEFQSKMQQDAYKNQLDMYNRQRQDSTGDMVMNLIGGGIGSIAGTYLNPIIGGYATKAGNEIKYGAGGMSPERQYYQMLMDYYMGKDTNKTGKGEF